MDSKPTKTCWGHWSETPLAPLCWGLGIFVDSPELVAGGHKIRSSRGRQKPLSPSTTECSRGRKFRKLVNTTPRRQACAAAAAAFSWACSSAARVYLLIFLLPAEPPLSQLSSLPMLGSDASSRIQPIILSGWCLENTEQTMQQE